MRGMGMQGEQGLDDAEQAMREAEGQLGQGQEGQAVDSQGAGSKGCSAACRAWPSRCSR
jgi:hypothetical protein